MGAARRYGAARVGGAFAQQSECKTAMLLRLLRALRGLDGAGDGDGMPAMAAKETPGRTGVHVAKGVSYASPGRVSFDKSFAIELAAEVPRH